MFNAGMKSKGKGSTDKHIVASSRTGLDQQVIKDWIGNRNKVEQGRTYEKAKPVHSRGITSYNCFVQENKEKLGKMENWSNSWNQLSLEDKSDYKEKAKEINSEPSEPLNHSKQLLKKICSLIKELADTGVEACLMGVDLNQNMIEMGTPKMCSFIKDNPEIVQKVYLHITNGNQKTNGTDRFEDISELRKKAQDQMNMLFSKAVEKESRFPYKKVQDGKITVSGVPAELLPIQRMSNYGKDKLKTIISLTELSVETKKPSSSENQTDNSTFQESDILTLTQEEYISLQNQDDIGVVELPNDFDLLTELIIPTVTVTTTEHELSHTTPISTTTQLGQTQKNIQSVTNKKITLAPSTSTKPSDTLTTIIRTPTVITNTSSTKTSMHTCTPVITAQPTQTTVHTHTTTNPTSDTLKTTNHTPNLISTDTAQLGQTQKAIQSVTNKKLTLAPSTSKKLSDTLSTKMHTTNLITTDTPSTSQLGQTQKAIQSVTNKKLTLAPSTSKKLSDTLSTKMHTPNLITTDTPSTSQLGQTQKAIQSVTNKKLTLAPSTSKKLSDTLSTKMHTPNLLTTDTPSTSQLGQTQKTIETTQTGTSNPTHTKKRKDSKDSEGSFKKNKIDEELNANFFRVAGILGEKKVGRKRMYLVHWDGYPVTQATWEPKGNIPSSIISCYNKKM